MEIVKVREMLTEVGLDNSGMPMDEAIKKIAIALLHIAESVDSLEGDMAAILSVLSETE